jgi:hypothetical protein
MIRDALVKVVSAKMIISAGGQHFNDAVADFYDGHIEGSAAKI